MSDSPIQSATGDNPDNIETTVPGEGADAGKTFFRTNRGVGIGLLVVIGFLGASIWFSDWAHRELRDGFTLGGFPLLAVGFMAFAALILILDGQAQTVEPEITKFRFGMAMTIVLAAAVLGIAFLSIAWIGFVPMVVLLVGGWATVLGYRPVWSAFVVGALVAAALRIIMQMLGVDIDDGLIWKLITGAGDV
jgi:hypothetical protein